MPFIPRQVKPPARIAVTCKLPQHVAVVLKCYAEFLDSSQEYVVAETLQLAFRKDREFQQWLAATHPDMATSGDEGSHPGRGPSRSSPGRTTSPATAAGTAQAAATPPVSGPSSPERGRS
jgi:hypothetical protein